MNYAMELSASGILTSMYRQDVLANNLANVDTVGYRPDLPATRQRDAAAQEDGLFNIPSNRLLERLGAGVLLQPNRTSTAQGPIETTSNSLDVAIQGSGFLVCAIAGGRDEARLRLTRDGRLTINSEGYLVQAANGYAVLNHAGDRIRINQSAGPVSIAPDGTISQRGAEVATLQFVDVPDPERLSKTGGGFYRPTAVQVSSFSPASGRLMAGAIERSSVDPIQAIIGITGAAADVANNTKVLQIADELMGRLISSVGRFA